MKLCTAQMTESWICTSVSTWPKTYGSFSLHKQNSAYFETCLYIWNFHIFYPDEVTVHIFQNEGKMGLRFHIVRYKITVLCTVKQERTIKTHKEDSKIMLHKQQEELRVPC
jgi:hypothetical protein